MASVSMLSQSWSMFALRGAIAWLLAGFALAAPGITLLSLIAVFAAYALLAGAVAVAGALRQHGDRNGWVWLLMGLVSVVAGVLAVMRPALAMLVLVMVIGANAVLTGLLELVLAVRARSHAHGEWPLVLSGAVSVLFGTLLLLYPGAGALAVVWLVGLYAALTGLLYLALAWRGYRDMARKRADAVADTKAAYSTPGGAAAATGAGGRVAAAMPDRERRVGERRMGSATGH